MDVTKYRALFIDESREHLAAIAQHLVASAHSEPDATVELIDELFRHAHSLKSMAAAMGLTPMAHLAHRLEDVVSYSRARKRPLADRDVQVLLHAVDGLLRQVEQVAAATDVHSEQAVLAEIDVLLAALSGQGQDAPIAKHRKVRIELVAGCPAPAARAYLICRKLATVAPLLQTWPAVEQIRQGQFDGSTLRVAFKEPVERPAVEAVIGSVAEVAEVFFEPLAPEVVPAAATAGIRGELAKTPRKSSSVRVRTVLLDAMMDEAGELFIAQQRLSATLPPRLEENVRAALAAMDKRVRHLHRLILAARLLPLSTLTDHYPRLVYALCQKLGKNARLSVQGQQLELDRTILDALDAPLLHLLRNAIDHGIEAPSVRRAAGKNEQGHIEVAASRDQDQVVLSVQDDGHGLDSATLQNAAIAQGLISAEAAQALDEAATFELMLTPGFSTKAGVTDVSGRGVGLDVVRRQLEILGGSLRIESVQGQWTRFILRAPLSVAMVPVVLFEAGHELLAVPASKVTAVYAVDAKLSPPAISLPKQVLPVTELWRVLALEPTAPSRTALLLPLESGTVAIGVSRLVGYQDVVVKSIGQPLQALECYSGATILGDGRAVLILDLAKLLTKLH